MSNNWPIKKLGEVCSINMGQSPVSLTYNTKKDGLPFYQGKKDYGEVHPIPRIWCSRPIKTVETGDILISVRAPVGSLNISSEKSCIGRGLAGISADKNVLDQDFLYRFLKLKEKEISDKGTGSTFTAISKKDIESIEIPLPPLKIQKEIVGKLDEKFAKLREVKRLREEALADTAKILPQTLHEIFESGKKNGWEEKKLEDVSPIRRESNKKLLPYVGMEDIESNSGTFLGSLEPKKVASNTFYFDKNCVLYGRLRPYLNKVFVPDFEGHCSTEMFPLVPNKELLSRKYLWYWLTQKTFIDQAMRTAGGARMPRANMKEVIKFKILIPFLAEQKQIVAKLDTLSVKLRTLRDLQNSQLTNLKNLEKAYLREAFRGELW